MNTDPYCTVGLDRWRTRLSLVVRRDQSALEPQLRTLLYDEVTHLEQVASRFVADSEISRVNAVAGAWTMVSWRLVEVLTAAIDSASQTDGLVNPCMGSAVDGAGYRAWRDGAAPDAVPATPGRAEWQQIEIRPAGSRARVRIPPDVSLDLGAVGKAWLADRLAAVVVESFGCDVVADMGGDLRIVGREEPWTVTADPGTSTPQSLLIDDAGLATSGTGRRQWLDASGRPAHHIIDPRTGSSAVGPWSSASVLASTAAGANTASTMAIILGEHAAEWLASRGVDAWLVGPDDQAHVGRWPVEVAA